MEFIKTWWQGDAAPPRQHRTLASLQGRSHAHFPPFHWLREKHAYLCMIAWVDGGFMSIYLLSSYLFVGFWFQHFMVQPYKPEVAHLHLIHIFAVFRIFLHIFLPPCRCWKVRDAWLLMKADEGENTAAAKHSGHFGCQLVRVTVLGSNSLLTL